MTNIEKIRQEIERRMKVYRKKSDFRDEAFGAAKIGTYRGLLEFIDSLPEETKDAEQEAARYERENRQSVLTSVDIVNAFIEGAKWQANQLLKSSPLPEDTVLFQKGVAEGRRLEREELPRWKKGPADSAICARDYWPVSNAPVLGKPETRDYLIVKRGESMLLAFHAEEGDYYLSTEELDKIPTE